MEDDSVQFTPELATVRSELPVCPPVVQCDDFIEVCQCRVNPFRTVPSRVDGLRGLRHDFLKVRASPTTPFFPRL